MSSNIWSKEEIEKHNPYIDYIMNYITSQYNEVIINEDNSDKLLIIAKAYYYYELYDKAKVILDLLYYKDRNIGNYFSYNYLLLAVLTKLFYSKYSSSDKYFSNQYVLYVKYAVEVYNNVLTYNKDEILKNENIEYKKFIYNVEDEYLDKINKIREYNNNNLIEIIKGCNHC